MRPMVNQSQSFWMPKIRPARNASPQPVGSVMRRSCAGGTSMVLPSAWITAPLGPRVESEEHTSELQSLLRLSYAVLRWKQKISPSPPTHPTYRHHETHSLP